MIAFVTSKLKLGVQYVREHPHLLLVFLLIVVLPILSLITNNAYIDSTRDIQERIHKDRVGLMHDTFRSLLVATDFNVEIAQRELTRLAEDNPDVLEFRISRYDNLEVIPIAALSQEVIGRPEINPQFYTTALANPNESFIYPNGRQWYTYRAVYSDEGDIYFIYVKFSLEVIDTVLENKRWEALPYFLFMLLVIAAVGYWLVKVTDYRYLYRQADSANKMKDLFTNMIAHELRAPLTAIRGYASMVEEKTDGEPHEYSVRVRESSERLLAIVNDLLDVARIQSGKLSVKTERTDVSPTVLKVIDELNVSGAEKSIGLHSEGTDSPHLLVADPKRLHQALTNLVSNSIKYTKQGSITVSVADKYDKVELRVKDTGMGISSEDQKKLFAPFFRVQSDDVSAITGTGLGMWITKQLIELMGGNIAVESIKGVGTHIVVTFPKASTK